MFRHANRVVVLAVATALLPAYAAGRLKLTHDGSMWGGGLTLYF